MKRWNLIALFFGINGRVCVCVHEQEGRRMSKAQNDLQWKIPVVSSNRERRKYISTMTCTFHRLQNEAVRSNTRKSSAIKSIVNLWTHIWAWNFIRIAIHSIFHSIPFIIALHLSVYVHCCSLSAFQRSTFLSALRSVCSKAHDEKKIMARPPNKEYDYLFGIILIREEEKYKIATVIMDASEDGNQDARHECNKL